MSAHESPIVVVRGHAAREVPPDFGTVMLTCSGESAVSQEDALSAALACADAVGVVAAEADNLRSVHVGRVQAGKRRRWVEATREYVDDGWEAVISVTVAASVDALRVLIPAVAVAGARVGWVSWSLDRDNPVYRETRKDAVRHAFTAAEDFADALGVTVGVLRVLADPGAGTAAVAASSRSGAAPAAAAASRPLEVDLDPAPIVVSASVEATYTLVP